MNPITIRPGANGRLLILFPYAPDLVEKIKTVPALTTPPGRNVQYPVHYRHD